MVTMLAAAICILYIGFSDKKDSQVFDVIAICTKSLLCWIRLKIILQQLLQSSYGVLETALKNKWLIQYHSTWPEVLNSDNDV